MVLVLLTIGLLALLFLIMVVLVRALDRNSVADIIDWKPTRSPEVEAQNEVDDVRQMLEAQNEYRRKRGAKEITEADVHRQAQEDEALRARGRGPFAAGGGLDDDVDEESPPPSPRRKPAATKTATRTMKAKAGAKAKPGAKRGGARSARSKSASKRKPRASEKS